MNLPELIAFGLSPTQARVFQPLLEKFMPMYMITTRLQICAFMAQAAHESMMFTHLEENLFYSSAPRLYSVFKSRWFSVDEPVQYLGKPVELANRVYALVNGNGDLLSGDGWRYRGRGIFMITGKNNYRSATEDVDNDFDYVLHPDLAALPGHAVRLACGYWKRNRLGMIADTGVFENVTRGVVGKSMLGHASRLELYQKAQRIWK